MPASIICVLGGGTRCRAALITCGVLLSSLCLSGPAVAQILNDGVGLTAGPESEICRIPYDGPQPTLVTPPAYIVDVTLPSIYCGSVNKWVFIYPTRAGVQLYRLDPGERESYRVIFSAASKGRIAPWAVGQSLPGGAAYLVNANPGGDTTFDYTVSPRAFDACIELSALRRLKTSSGEQVIDCSPTADDGLAGRRQ